MGEPRSGNGGIEPIGLASHKRGLIIATVAALLLTITGAFGTITMPILPRLAHWLIIMETGALLGIGASSGIRTWGRLAHNRLAEGTLICIVIAAPLTLAAAGATLAFAGGPAPTAASLAITFLMVVVIAIPVTALNYMTARTDPPPAPQIAEAEPPAQRLRERLPPHLRAADIRALQAEDHYLRVHTSAGDALILMRLGDAIEAVDGIEGARTHRSWWVSRDAVRSVTRGEGRAELLLEGGIAAPISRASLPALRDAGWLS